MGPALTERWNWWNMERAWGPRFCWVSCCPTFPHPVQHKLSSPMWNTQRSEPSNRVSFVSQVASARRSTVLKHVETQEEICCIITSLARKRIATLCFGSRCSIHVVVCVAPGTLAQTVPKVTVITTIVTTDTHVLSKQRRRIVSILWMDAILHHFEAMGNHCSLILQRNHHSRFRPSHTVNSPLRTDLEDLLAKQVVFGLIWLWDKTHGTILG